MSRDSSSSSSRSSSSSSSSSKSNSSIVAVVLLIVVVLVIVLVATQKRKHMECSSISAAAVKQASKITLWDSVNMLYEQPLQYLAAIYNTV